MNNSILKKIHCKSKHHEIKLMHPSSLKAFQIYQEHNSKAPQFGGSHNYKTKQITLLHK
jgi:hypothetical protein